jgi:hypothetical protein
MTYDLRCQSCGFAPEGFGLLPGYFSRGGDAFDVEGQGSPLAFELSTGYYMDIHIVISGDRHWRCDDLAEQVLNRLLARNGPNLVIVHGGANGVDQAFHLGAQALAIDVEPHLANWQSLGNIAGPSRNREMVNSGADLCIALRRTLETSKGTKDCVRQALAAGIAVWLIEDDRAVPRRVQADDERLA